MTEDDPGEARHPLPEDHRMQTIRAVARKADEMIALATVAGLTWLLPHLVEVKREAERLLAAGEPPATRGGPCSLQ